MHLTNSILVKVFIGLARACQGSEAAHGTCSSSESALKTLCALSGVFARCYAMSKEIVLHFGLSSQRSAQTFSLLLSVTLG